MFEIRITPSASRVWRESVSAVAEALSRRGGKALFCAVAIKKKREAMAVSRRVRFLMV